jgi:hypothetical protein
VHDGVGSSSVVFTAKEHKAASGRLDHVLAKEASGAVREERKEVTDAEGRDSRGGWGWTRVKGLLLSVHIEMRM